MRKFIPTGILLIVLVTASVASAQVSFTPGLHIGFDKFDLEEVEGTSFRKTSMTETGLNMKIQASNQLSITATYATRSGGNIEDGGAEYTPETNRGSRWHLQGRFIAYDLGFLVLGPVLDYQNFTWELKVDPHDPEYKEVHSGLGIGVFASTEIHPAELSLALVYRPKNRSRAYENGVLQVEEEGTGLLLDLSASIPVSESFMITAGYQSDRLNEFDDMGSTIRFTNSGFRIGATYAF